MRKKLLKRRLIQVKKDNLSKRKRHLISQQKVPFFQISRRNDFSYQVNFMIEKYFDLDDKIRYSLLQNISKLARKDILKSFPILYEKSFEINDFLDIAYNLFTSLSDNEKKLLGDHIFMNWTMFDEPFVRCSENEFNHLSKEEKDALFKAIENRNKAVDDGKTKDSKISMNKGSFYRLHTPLDYDRFQKTLEIMMASRTSHCFMCHGWDD